MTAFLAWRNVLAITLLGVVVAGLGCFVGLAGYLRSRFDLFQAAAWLQVGFTGALALLLALIVLWQRRRGQSLADLGWRRPTTRLALALSVVLAVAYLWSSYFGARFVLPKVDVLELSWVRCALIPLGLFMAVGEEVMMRGFFLTELHRARVPTWVQILASGVCSASYHSLQNPSLLGFLPSFILFSLHAGLYVLGRRSLTPCVLAHGAYHLFGEPYLIMMALATMHT
jgi:membrane protease YdiL (CAAX protease family)